MLSQLWTWRYLILALTLLGLLTFLEIVLRHPLSNQECHSNETRMHNIYSLELIYLVIFLV